MPIRSNRWSEHLRRPPLWRRLVAVAAVGALAGAGLVGCGADTPDKPAGKPVLRIGVGAAAPSLDPAKNNVDYHLYPLLYESLIIPRSDGSFAPGLATAWRYVGDNNTSFELTLRTDARFSDGTPVDAEAVRTWLDYFSKAGGQFATRMGKIQSIEAVDQSTVRINLAGPNPVVPAVLAQINWGLVASPKAVANPTELGTKGAGAGQYALDPAETLAGDHFTLLPNQNYYDQSKIKFSKIVIRVIADPSSLVQAAQSGQLDVVAGTAATADIAAAAGFTVVHSPGFVESFIFTDRNGTLAAPLKDVRVRKALNYAVDRKAIAQALGGKYGTPAADLPTLDGEHDPAYQNYYPYDPAKAKSLLTEAGYPDGFTVKFLEPVGKSNLTQAVAKYLGEVGVKLDVTTSTNPADFAQKLGKRDMPVVNVGLPTFFTVWQYYTATWEPGSFWNFTNWIDPTLISLGQDGAKAADGSKYWDQISRRAVEEAYFLPLYLIETVYFVSKTVDNVTLSARGGFPHPPDWSPRG